MSLVLPRCLEDSGELWNALQAHWRAGRLVGLARPEERVSLAGAVLGPQGGRDTGARPRTGTTEDREEAGGRRDRPGASAGDRRVERRMRTERGTSGTATDDAGGGPGQAEQGGALHGAGAGAGSEAIRNGPWGPSLVIGSGGSSGGRRWCVQPVSHLEASAAATADWLAARGIDPGACLHLNALPMHHISGLMPLVRAHRWGAELRGVPPQLLRDPSGLEQACPLPADRPVLLSLVPTQLHRLLEEEAACRWLRRCRVIWVGGAALPADLAERARQAALPLAPCYGATETAAMVCALPPDAFLGGREGCGAPLRDVRIQLREPDGAVAVRTGRLSPGWFERGVLRPFTSGDGWWRSGDGGQWLPATGTDGADSLRIRGRLDGAILSGGETVFPEQLEQRLRLEAAAAGLPLAAVLLLGVPEAPWGERLAALVRPHAGSDGTALLQALQTLADRWPAPERPRRWWLCRDLAPTEAGKWDRAGWRRRARTALARGAQSPEAPEA